MDLSIKISEAAKKAAQDIEFISVKENDCDNCKYHTPTEYYSCNYTYKGKASCVRNEIIIQQAINEVIRILVDEKLHFSDKYLEITNKYINTLKEIDKLKAKLNEKEKYNDTL